MSLNTDANSVLKRKQKDANDKILTDLEITRAFGQFCKESGELLKEDKWIKGACVKQLQSSRIELTQDTVLADLPEEERAAFEKKVSDGLWKILNSRDFSRNFQGELKKVVLSEADTKEDAAAAIPKA
jgi:hypothetical protein